GGGAGGGGSGAFARGNPAGRPNADRRVAARLQDRAVVDSQRVDRAVDPALRLQRRHRPECAAADDPLAAGLRDADGRPGRHESRLAAADRYRRPPDALRHRLLVAVLSRWRLVTSRLPQVRGASAYDSLEADKGSDADDLRASVLRRSPDAAGRQGGPGTGRDLSVAAGRLPRLCALRLLGLQALD